MYCNGALVYGDPVSGNYIFSAFYKDVDRRIHMYHNQMELLTTGSFDPRFEWDPEWQVFFDGVGLHLEDDIPGTDPDRVQLTGVQKATSSTSDWADIQNLTFDPNPCRYHHRDLGSGADFEEWTKPRDSTSC